jgi:heat-inducible transcriptional repressor
MPRNISNDNRKNRVLAAAVSCYIDTGEPVSSKELAKKFSLSSATLRNILSELEDEGYLFHPHTSAGRVPTDRGYRYYVDFLMDQNKLSEQQMALIMSEYKSIDPTIEHILEKTTEIVAGLTHYTAIASLSQWEDKIFYKGLSNIFQHREFHDYQKIALLVRMMEEKKYLLELINTRIEEPLKIYIGEDMHCPFSSDIALVVTSYKGGKSQGKIAVLGPRRMSYVNTVSALESLSGVLHRLLENI